MGQKLCCVFTWVQRDATAASPFMITFDGSRRNYDSAATFVAAAEAAYSAVCVMSMGGSDCATVSKRCPSGQPTSTRLSPTTSSTSKPTFPAIQAAAGQPTNEPAVTATSASSNYSSMPAH